MLNETNLEFVLAPREEAVNMIAHLISAMLIGYSSFNIAVHAPSKKDMLMAGITNTIPEELAGVWHVTKIANFDLPTGAEVTVEFQGNTIGGIAACRRYSAEIAIEGALLNQREMSLRGKDDCDEAFLIAEQKIIGAVQLSDRYQLTDDGLLTLLSQNFVQVTARRDATQ
jgi:heat shock protein HslJ